MKAPGALFLQVLKLCGTAGLVKLGHVALDGARIKANESKYGVKGYEHMKRRGAAAEERRIEAEKEATQR